MTHWRNCDARASCYRDPQASGVWRDDGSLVYAVSIPRYNSENGGYIEKYQSILSLFG
jgi:hypothetical protein